MRALDFINSDSPIPYVKNFLDAREADALFALIQTMTPVREKNKRNSNTLIRMLRYGTYVRDPASRTKAVYGPKLDILSAPEGIVSLLAKLSAHAGKDINYLSVLGYADQYDHINFHQHREDLVESDQSVVVISLGHVRELVLRPKDCKDRSQYATIMPEHGSLYVLPSEYNVTHEHQIPDSKYRCGLRISINCKHEDDPDPKNRKCSVEGCNKLAFGTHRPEHNITSNGKCVSHSGSETYIASPFVRKPGPPRIYNASGEYPQDAV